MGINLFYRVLAPVLLILHATLRLIFPHPGIANDLLIYNGIAIWATLRIFSAPGFNDRVGRLALGSALFLWSTGSFLSTYNEFFNSPHINPNISNTCYLLLYPCALVGLPRVLRAKRKLVWLEILDATILGIGLSSIGSAFLIAPVLPHFDGNVAKTFFAILFPLADLVLFALVLALAFISPPTWRSLLISTGVIAFGISDFLFLWLTIHQQYSFGSLSDDGWLLGIVLISESVWHRGADKRDIEPLHPVFVALSVMMSATLLAITSLRPGYFPDFILLPTIATLLLAFVRMTIALRQARTIGEERLLARTDELTGLPNRRRFIAELGALGKLAKLDGALLLLDLDGFKPINDQFGHEVGDQLLKQVSIRFSRALPEGSLLARLGGDEFGAIVRGDYETTLEVALALRATLSYPFSISGREICVGVSVGHVGNDGASDLLRRADSAMYQAKREGTGVWSEPARI